jgi:hypothetical protein
MPTARAAALHATAKDFSAVAQPRHKRETNARRKSRAVVVAGPLAALATASAVTLGVFSSDPATRDLIEHQASGQVTGTSSARTSLPVSRGDSRQSLADEAVAEPDLMSREAVRAAIENASEKRWTTAQLNIWSEPSKQAEVLGELESGVKVLITGRAAQGRVEIVLRGKSRWVTEGYLTKEEPPSLGGPCLNGTSVPSAVSANVEAVHQAVCAAFPSITSFGTLRGGGGDHGTGHAIDIMVSGSLGYQVAEFVRENYVALGVSYVIYAQRIWSVERAGEGWRGMASRGSATANHYDHVHVSVF